jgi:hypothetical protein
VVGMSLVDPVRSYEHRDGLCPQSVVELPFRNLQ